MNFITTEPVEIRKRYADRFLTRLPMGKIERLLCAPCTFMYHNTMEPGAVAGNHYHLKKKEVFLCTHGELDVVIVDRNTGISEMSKLSSNPASPHNVLMSFPLGFAHAVKNATTGLAIITVFSNYDPGDGDEISYKCL